MTLRQRAESTSDVPKFTMACDESREMCGKKCLQTGEKFESNPCRFFVYFLIIEEERENARETRQDTRANFICHCGLTILSRNRERLESKSDQDCLASSYPLNF